MFSCTVNGVPGHPVVKLSGSLTLEHSRKIHAELLAHLRLTEVLTIDMGEWDKLELSFIQILFALLKDPEKIIHFANIPTHLFDNAASLGAGNFMVELSNRLEKNA